MTHKVMKYAETFTPIFAIWSTFPDGHADWLRGWGGMIQTFESVEAVKRAIATLSHPLNEDLRSWEEVA